MEHDPQAEARIIAAFEVVGDALIHVLAAAAKDDWDKRHRAAEEFGRAAAGVYRALCTGDAGAPS